MWFQGVRISHRVVSSRLCNKDCRRPWVKPLEPNPFSPYIKNDRNPKIMAEPTY